MLNIIRTSVYAGRLGITVLALVTAATALSFFADATTAQKRQAARHGVICGNPNVPCRTSATFPPNDLPFRIPAKANIYDTDLFYAVILKSVSVPDENCDTFIPESDRLAAQALFPDRKVFSSRCADPGGLSYTNTSPNARFIAVYAGMTLAEANKMLATVKATEKYPAASVRRMRAAFNGT